MSLRQFGYAPVLAEEGSVTAAELLRVAQPSVSQQIRGLERDLDVELFVRTSTGPAPTVAAHAFLQETEVAASAARRAESTAQAGSEEPAGELWSRRRWAWARENCRAHIERSETGPSVVQRQPA